jgi:hypothetical protein
MGNKTYQSGLHFSNPDIFTAKLRSLVPGLPEVDPRAKQSFIPDSLYESDQFPGMNFQLFKPQSAQIPDLNDLEKTSQKKPKAN